jgi:hypothetical protein
MAASLPRKAGQDKENSGAQNEQELPNEGTAGVSKSKFIQSADGAEQENIDDIFEK